MHEELSGAGARTVRNWTVLWFVLVVLVGAFYTLFATAASSGRVIVVGLLVGAAAGAGVAMYLLVRGEHHAIRTAWPKASPQGDTRLTAGAEEFALALGVAPPSVHRVESDSPNVAAFPGSDRSTVIVSSAAAHGLTASELDALVALQLSLLHNPKARRARRSVVASSLVFVPVIAMWLICSAVGAVIHHEPLVAFVLGVFVNVGVGALFVYVRRRIRWGWGLLSDGVAVATTRHPGPLVHGLRRIASHNGDPIPTKAWLGQGDPYWVVPVRTHASSTVSSNGKMISQSSTELLNDGELLMRASLVEDVCVRSGPATKAHWDEAAAVFRHLTRSAADPTAAPGVAGGSNVTVFGMADDDIGPVHGSWVDPNPAG